MDPLFAIALILYNSGFAGGVASTLTVEAIKKWLQNKQNTKQGAEEINYVFERLLVSIRLNKISVGAVESIAGVLKIKQGHSERTQYTDLGVAIHTLQQEISREAQTREFLHRANSQRQMSKRTRL